MRLKKAINKKSIGSKVFNNFIFIILLISISFAFLLYQRNISTKQYEKVTEINIKLNKLSLEFSNSWGFFDMFIKTKDNENIKKYTDSNNKIKDLITEVKPYIEKEKDSSIYLRNLNNMFDFYKIESSHLIREALYSGQLNSKNYEKLTQLKTLYTYINKHSQQLVVAYLNYSNSEYSIKMMKYKKTEIKIYFALIFIIFVSFFFTMLISRDLNKTMGRLQKYAELLSAGKWEIPDLEDQKYDELNSLAKAFDKMKHSIREFIKELKEKTKIENNYHIEQRKSIEKDKLIKETQLSALQSQMDPHFLFNTLNTISRMAMFEYAQQTVKLIEATSKILRYNLDCKDKMVELKEEIRSIEAYVIIQETRFQDQMSFSFDIDKNLNNIRIPPMLIQPIVENAIIHGLREKEKDGIINITVKEQESFISINIKDNGIGMDNEKICNLLSDVKNNSIGLGVFNVKKRLELCFNRKDLFRVNSQIGHGTEIIIFIPIDGGEGSVKTFNS